MIALEVSLNGKRVCVAGAEDLQGLSASVEVFGKLGQKSKPLRPDKSEDLYFSVGGMDSRKDVYQYWQLPTSMKVGDVIQVRILESDSPDPPQSVAKVY